MNFRKNRSVLGVNSMVFIIVGSCVKKEDMVKYPNISVAGNKMLLGFAVLVVSLLIMFASNTLFPTIKFLLSMIIIGEFNLFWVLTHSFMHIIISKIYNKVYNNKKQYVLY